MLERIGVELRQRAPAGRAIAVQEADGGAVDVDRRGEILAPRERVEKRVARRLRVVDVGDDPRLPAAQQLALEQRVGEPQRRMAQRLDGGAARVAAGVDALDDERAVVDPAQDDPVEIRRERGRGRAAVDDLARGPEMRQRLDRLADAFEGREPEGVVGGGHSSPGAGCGACAVRGRISSR